MKHLQTYWPIIALISLLCCLAFCRCHDVTPSETSYSKNSNNSDTIKDTVYRSYKNGKLFGVEIEYRKRKSIKDYR